MASFLHTQTIEHGMFVRERSPDRSRVLLFVHGLGESGLCFEHLLDHPGLDGFHRLVVDLPGYGRSPWQEQPMPLEEQADHLAGWLSARDVAGLDLTFVGHSMGGVLGVLFAERHPRCLGALLNVDGNLSPGDCVFSGRAAELPLDTFLDAGFDRLRDAVYRQGARDEAHRGYYVSLRLCDPRQFHLNSLELIEMSAAETLPGRMAHLEVAAHYVAGVPRGACARSRELLDEHAVPWSAVEPAGHWPFIDQPDRFVEILRASVG
jgi:pimeloyl-ACP methyl ester carboxylesterase